MRPPTSAIVRFAVFAAYCVAASALVLTLDADRHVGFVVCAFALSVVLGRLLPGWGFAAPPFLAALWLMVALAATEPGMGRGLGVVFIFIGVAITESGVLVGSLSAAWSWTTRGLRESSGSAER